MLDKIVPVSEPEIEAKLGGYNDVLPNMQEITMQEFGASGFFSYTPAYITFRQIDPARMQAAGLEPSRYWPYRAGHTTVTITNAKVFVFSDLSGYVMAKDWKQGVRVFKFAVCKHEHAKEEMIGRCLRRMTCPDCGFTREVDSSD